MSLRAARKNKLRKNKLRESGNLGPLGQLITQYARVMGAEEILAIDPIAGRLEIARAHGATRSFAGSAGEAVDFVRSHTQDRLADVVFDATGHYAVFPLALKLTRTFGTMMLIGDSPQPSKQTLQADVITSRPTTSTFNIITLTLCLTLCHCVHAL